MKILIVEDNEPLGALLAQRLEKRGHQVSVTAEAADAHASAKAFQPDLILLEAQLRGGEDWAAARRLKFKGRVGIFVKAAKRGQDLRLDLPTVGVKTVEAAARADGALKPQRVIEEVYRQLQAAGRVTDTILTTGVGQHQMWTAQYYRWQVPRSLITSGGAGTMGFGLPAAIGCKLAAPDKTVIDVDGDGSFLMTGMEFVTAVQYKIGVKVLLINNNFQGMVRQWQDLCA